MIHVVKQGEMKSQRTKKKNYYIYFIFFAKYYIYFIFVMTSQCSFRKALKDKLDKSIVYLKTIKT